MAAGYLALALTFILGCVVASGFWIESGPLGLAAFIVVLAVPLAAAYFHDLSVPTG